MNPKTPRFDRCLQRPPVTRLWRTCSTDLHTVSQPVVEAKTMASTCKRHSVMNVIRPPKSYPLR
ncbi:hypothetical protein KIN20_034478 [Parelaphostrongylus tenuis]|uniref:Uncharacterized protein n=1 Tax=Parelaphostrongylus tenuis TaxID=148309 RepID=A0AAD5R9K3_PARTN|nr:hypothetical protein KIN20_034478 [Parelaphostrongylus tenuis]